MSDTTSDPAAPEAPSLECLLANYLRHALEEFDAYERDRQRTKDRPHARVLAARHYVQMARDAASAPPLDVTAMARPTVDAMLTLMRLAGITTAPEYWRSEWTAALVSFGDMLLKQSAAPGAAAVSQATEPDPRLESHYPDELLRHAVQAPSQYTAEFRLLAGEILRLRELLKTVESPAAVSPLALPSPAKLDVLDALHDVFTRHGMASRSDFPYGLISDLVSWAAKMCRQSQPEPVSPLALEEQEVDKLPRFSQQGLDEYPPNAPKAYMRSDPKGPYVRVEAVKRLLVRLRAARHE